MQQAEDCIASTRNHTKKPLEINSSGFSYTASGYHSYDHLRQRLNIKAVKQQSQYRKRLSFLRRVPRIQTLRSSVSQYRKRLSLLRLQLPAPVQLLAESQYRKR